MSYRDFERGQGIDMDWGGRGNGYRGQFSRQDQQGRFSGWGNEGTGRFQGSEFRGQERFAGGEYGQGGYGQEYGRQASDWPRDPYGAGESYGGGRWNKGYRDESQFGGGRGYGGEGYGRQGFSSSGGWQPNAEQGWGNQGRTRAGSWDQDWTWERGPSGRGNWGQGYSDQDFGEQGQFQQDFSGQRFRGQNRPGGGTFYYEETWLIPGPHSGRGPRGYQRNDQRIEEDICERLTQHGQIDASDLQVQVKNGEVTLTGTVEDRRTKRMAEDVLDSISGIKDVHNQLRVQQAREQADQQDRIVSQGQPGQSGSRGSQSRGRSQSQRNETATAGASNA